MPSPAPSAPALVSSVGLAASMPPVEAMDEGWAERRLADMLRFDRAAGADALTELYQGYADDPASIFSSWDDPNSPDVGLLALPGVNDAMVQMVREAARQGSIGAVADDIAVLEPSGFSAADVTQDVGVWLGSENSECRSAADYFATTIPRATYVIFPGEGHLEPLPRWAEMLAWLH